MSIQNQSILIVGGTSGLGFELAGALSPANFEVRELKQGGGR